MGAELPKVVRVSREAVLERFYSAVVNQPREDIPENAIQVTELAYTCLRRAWFARKYGSRFFDLETHLRLWIGKAVHMFPILEQSELMVQWSPEPGTKYPIVGIVDDYSEPLQLLLEKKVTLGYLQRLRGRKFVPFEHHLDQVNYYRVLLERNGYPVNNAFLLYIDLVGLELELVEVELREFHNAENELKHRWKTLVKAIETATPPPKVITESCRFCEYIRMCNSA